MSEKSKDPKDAMPTERKSMWRTAEERRMSDLTRVLEWHERRQRKDREAQQKQKAKESQVVAPPAASRKEEKKAPNTQKSPARKGRVLFSDQQNLEVTHFGGVGGHTRPGPWQATHQPPAPKASGPSSRKDRDAVTHRKLYGVEPKGQRISMVPGNYLKDGPGKSDLESKDPAGLESMPRSGSFRRQSAMDPLLQDPLFAGRKSTLLREWVSKMPDATYERKMKTLMEKGMEPKVETVRVLKPEEVLSCRYLRLSQNNIRTLLKLCKDAGTTVDIHPHMVEGEIDTQKVFGHSPTVAL